MPPEPPEEVEEVEEVDEHGSVVRVVTRAQMRAENLRHRCVGIVVRRPGDRSILVHRRADWKDVWPGHWDLAFGGVCGVGEAPEDAARRELAEEAGLTVTGAALRFVGQGTFEDDAVRAVGWFYEVDHGGPFIFADGEVEEVAWVALANLPAWLATHQVVPDSRAMVVPRLEP